MARAYKCDRCGNHYDKKTDEMPYKIVNKHNSDVDLCPDCLYTLEDWMEHPTPKEKRGRKTGQRTWSVESKEKSASRMADLNVIARAIQEREGCDWNEARSKAFSLMRVGKEKDMSVEDILKIVNKKGADSKIELDATSNVNTDDVETNEADVHDLLLKDGPETTATPKCSMCGTEPVEKAGQMCESCKSKFDEYEYRMHERAEAKKLKKTQPNRPKYGRNRE